MIQRMSRFFWRVLLNPVCVTFLVMVASANEMSSVPIDAVVALPPAPHINARPTSNTAGNQRISKTRKWGEVQNSNTADNNTAATPPIGVSRSSVFTGMSNTRNTSADVPQFSLRRPSAASSSVPSPPETPKPSLSVSSNPEPSGHRVATGSAEFWMYVGIAAFAVLFAGFASGMTVGLLSLDPIQLKVFQEEGSEDERKRASQVSKIISNHHLLLVTLLLANSISMEALPIFLDRIVPSWMAVLLSVTFILFFGEVLPQAFCTGPRQLDIAAAAAPAVRFLIWILFFISWPVAKALDHILGHDSQTYYTRPHLKTLIRMHQKERRVRQSSSGQGSAESDASSALGADEVVVIEGALDLATKTLKEIMLPLDQLYMIEYSTLMTQEALEDVVRAGHSRVPVYKGSRHNVRGLILVKSLLLLDPSKPLSAGELMQKRHPLFKNPETNAYDMLNEFQQGQSHIVFVTPNAEEYYNCVKVGQDVSDEARILGVATLEDVIEELIQEEIYDEFDNRELLAGGSGGAVPVTGIPVGIPVIPTTGNLKAVPSSAYIEGDSSEPLVDDASTGAPNTAGGSHSNAIGLHRSTSLGPFVLMTGSDGNGHHLESYRSRGDRRYVHCDAGMGANSGAPLRLLSRRSRPVSSSMQHIPTVLADDSGVRGPSAPRRLKVAQRASRESTNQQSPYRALARAPPSSGDGTDIPDPAARSPFLPRTKLQEYLFFSRVRANRRHSTAPQMQLLAARLCDPRGLRDQNSRTELSGRSIKRSKCATPRDRAASTNRETPRSCVEFDGTDPAAFLSQARFLSCPHSNPNSMRSDIDDNGQRDDDSETTPTYGAHRQGDVPAVEQSLAAAERCNLTRRAESMSPDRVNTEERSWGNWAHRLTNKMGTNRFGDGKESRRDRSVEGGNVYHLMHSPE